MEDRDMKGRQLGKPVLDGEPTIYNIPDGQSALWSLGCCDCGLYHLFVIHREGDVISIRPYRDAFLTEKYRGMSKKKKK
jgi:hypothetical protein